MNTTADHDVLEREQPRLFASMWRYKLMSVLIVGACVLLSAGVGFLVAPPATAVATIALKTPMANNVLSPGATGDATLARYTVQRARFVTSDAVISAVAEELGRSDVAGVRANVSATPAANSNILTVEVTAETPEEAVELADAVVAAYRSQTRTQVEVLTADAIAAIEASAGSVRQNLAQSPPSGSVEANAAATLGQLQLQASEITTNSALLGDGVEFVVAPRLDSVVVAGFPLREMALGLVVGLVIAATVSWLRADREMERELAVISEHRSDDGDEVAGEPPGSADMGAGVQSNGTASPARPGRSSRESTSGQFDLPSGR